MNDFYYYNINPTKNVEEDCVCRAISLASGISYNIIDKLLKLVSKSNQCDKLCVCCYHKLLEDIFGYRVKFVYKKKTVGQIANEYKNNTLIVRINGHLTACVNGCCVDIWDCTNEKVDCFWIVENY